jgi:pimeloyl-ACP methyl ester carboxylesterase
LGDLTFSGQKMPETPVQFVTRADGVRLAFRHLPGRGPTLVFLPGYKSDMQGGKALAMDAWAADQGVGMLRLDYSGCGESEGVFEDGTLDIWRDDVLAVIARAVDGPLILIGSSMGGWLMLLVADALGDQVTAMVGIAAAPDFTDWDFDEADRATIAATGRIERPSDYGYDPMVITQGFWQSGQANLRLTRGINIFCPVRLLHGQCDPDVPWETSLRLAAALCSSDVQTILLKDGDHRLSRDQDIALLIDTVTKLI